jgi:hypothetical protein
VRGTEKRGRQWRDLEGFRFIFCGLQNVRQPCPPSEVANAARFTAASGARHDSGRRPITPCSFFGRSLRTLIGLATPVRKTRWFSRILQIRIDRLDRLPWFASMMSQLLSVTVRRKLARDSKGDDNPTIYAFHRFLDLVGFDQ